MNELLREYRNLCYKSAKDDITDKELDREDELHEEIDRRLKLLDYFVKPFSPELIAEMERQFKELNE